MRQPANCSEKVTATLSYRSQELDEVTMWHVKCGNAEYSEVSEASQTAVHNSYRSDQVDSNQSVKVAKGFRRQRRLRTVAMDH